MKRTIEVINKREGELIAAGLAIPEVRAFVKVVAALHSLPTDRARVRVLTWLQSKGNEERYASQTDARL